MIRALVLAMALVATAHPIDAAGGEPPAPAPAPAPSPARRGVEAADIDRRIDPCTDFFEYSSGAWRAANPIPAAMPRWSRRLSAREANTTRLQGLLDALSARADWPAGSVEQLAGDHYASCMNVAAVDAAGLTPLAPLLASITAARTPADIQRVIRRLHELAIPVAFGTTGGLDYHEPRTFGINITAGRLGLPDRDYYLKPDARFAEARARYAAHVARLLELAGMSPSRTAKAARPVVVLEQRLAGAALDAASASDPARTDHAMPFAQLEALAPHIDWVTYFDEAGLARTRINVAEPDYLRAVDRELHETPVSTWKTYLTAHLVDAASPWLSRPFTDESFSFTDAFLGGAARPQTRAQRCAESTEALFPDAVGRKYVERYFAPSSRARVQEILRNLLVVLTEEVRRIDWMTPQTKATALDKLATYNPQVGYPDHWKDYSTVKVDRNTLWANVAAARRFAVDDNRRQVGTPSDPGLWQLPASAAGAYLDLQLNSIVLPAGFLQAPVFDPDANDAVNYGSFGAAVAHDMIHAIDTLGAENDTLGRPINWWTDADTQAFTRRTQCVVDQFDGYTLEPGLHLDGTRVLREAIGDLGGIRLAYLALQRAMTSHPVPIVDGFTPDQQFFIAAAQARAESIRIDTQRLMVKNDSHPVPRFRVNGPLSNLTEFHRAFACNAESAMVRPPAKRCVAW